MYIAQTHLQLVYIYQLPTYVCICITAKNATHIEYLSTYTVYICGYIVHTPDTSASHHPFPIPTISRVFRTGNQTCIIDQTLIIGKYVAIYPYI